MRNLISTPDSASIKKWGPLAYVSEPERKRIMSEPDFKWQIKLLEKDIAAAKKKTKR